MTSYRDITLNGLWKNNPALVQLLGEMGGQALELRREAAERRRAEAALRDREYQYRSLVEQMREGILAGDPLLTVRGDVAEECWRILEPVVEAWQNGSVEMHEYRAGSTGPTNWS